VPASHVQGYNWQAVKSIEKKKTTTWESWDSLLGIKLDKS
jgi:hypothetical protein